MLWGWGEGNEKYSYRVIRPTNVVTRAIKSYVANSSVEMENVERDVPSFGGRGRVVSAREGGKRWGGWTARDLRRGTKKTKKKQRRRRHGRDAVSSKFLSSLYWRP